MRGVIEVEKPLSLRDQFRLVVIAYETSNPDIRKAALEVLERALHPMVALSAPGDWRDPASHPPWTPERGHELAAWMESMGYDE